MQTSNTRQAIAYLMAGHSCSQAVLMAYSTEFNLSPDLAARLAAGFAGGLAQGDICGAVSGAVMVAGLVYGPGTDLDTYAKDHCYMVTREFCHRFKKRRHTVKCREILRQNRVDFQDPDQMKQLRGTGLCAEVVSDALDILGDLLREEI